jgi:hypothetical protein
MKAFKTVIYIVIALALAVGSYYGWKFYSKAKTPVLDALYILPNDAAVVIGFNDYNKFNAQLGNESLIWQDIRNMHQLDSKKEAVDSILNELSKLSDFESVLNNPLTKLYISIILLGVIGLRLFIVLACHT